MIGCIYCIENIVNHKKYIGKTTRPTVRWETHQKYLLENRHANQHLQNSVNKYGLNNFIFYIIKYTKSKYLNRLEKLYIRIYKTYDSQYGYNKTMGGDGGAPTKDIILKKTFRNNKIGVKYISKFIDKGYKQGFRYRYSHPSGKHIYSYDLNKLKEKALERQYDWIIINPETYMIALKENDLLRKKYGRQGTHEENFT